MISVERHFASLFEKSVQSASNLTMHQFCSDGYLDIL